MGFVEEKKLPYQQPEQKTMGRVNLYDFAFGCHDFPRHLIRLVLFFCGIFVLKENDFHPLLPPKKLTCKHKIGYTFFHHVFPERNCVIFWEVQDSSATSGCSVHSSLVSLQAPFHSLLPQGFLQHTRRRPATSTKPNTKTMIFSPMPGF